MLSMMYEFLKQALLLSILGQHFGFERDFPAQISRFRKIPPKNPHPPEKKKQKQKNTGINIRNVPKNVLMFLKNASDVQ